jgi:hypothetical protein
MLIEPSRFASLVVTSWDYKAGGRSYTIYIFSHDLPSSLCLLPNGGGIVPSSLLFHGGVAMVCIGGHARAPAKPCESGVYDSDRVSYLSCARRSCILCSGGGYIMVCIAFYERGFGVSSHRFLCSLLQFYGLELHHLTPSGILHMAAFVTLCEA